MQCNVMYVCMSETMVESLWIMTILWMKTLFRWCFSESSCYFEPDWINQSSGSTSPGEIILPSIHDCILMTFHIVKGYLSWWLCHIPCLCWVSYALFVQLVDEILILSDLKRSIIILWIQPRSTICSGSIPIRLLKFHENPAGISGCLSF